MTLSGAVGWLMYLSVAVLTVGTACQVARYLRAPVPLKIPITPAPTTGWGVAGRIAREVLLFESLFKASRSTWLFGWLFHAGLLWLALGHLAFFLPGSVPLLERVASTMGLAGWLTAAGLTGLAFRRVLVDRIRYVSAPSDYLMLGLLLAIVCTGMLVAVMPGADRVVFKAYVQGLYAGYTGGLPDAPFLWLHIVAACVLGLVFPFSKLLHAPGVFLSPTRLQADNSREHRR